MIFRSLFYKLLCLIGDCPICETKNDLCESIMMCKRGHFCHTHCAEKWYMDVCPICHRDLDSNFQRIYNGA